jgi:hypothetical protein
MVVYQIDKNVGFFRVTYIPENECEGRDYKPINDTIDKIVHAVRGCSGECTTNLDDWSSLKTFEWYLSLTDEDKIGYGIKT